jgi:hypothetical protein
VEFVLVGLFRLTWIISQVTCCLGGRNGEAYLEVPKLSKLLSTGIQQTGKWFCLHVGDLVGADVAPLCEALVADFAFEWLFACVSALMGLDRGSISMMIRSSKDKGQ